MPEQPWDFDNGKDPDPVVLIVDDDVSVRKGISSILRSVGFAAREFISADDFLAAPPVDAPCCLILDVRLPGMSGLALQTQIQSSTYKIPIVMITGHGDVPMSVRALKAGAVDFLTKPFRDQEIIDAVSSAIEVDRQRRKAAKATERLLSLYNRLTSREQGILRLVCQGLMNKQIAAEVGLSEITVKIHRGQVMRKMQARSLPDLVRMAEFLKPHVERG